MSDTICLCIIMKKSLDKFELISHPETKSLKPPTRTYAFWPGMDEVVLSTVHRCSNAKNARNSLKEWNLV